MSLHLAKKHGEQDSPTKKHGEQDMSSYEPAFG